MARQSAPVIPVLVTRPQAEGEGFAAALVARFGARVRPVLTPLMTPLYLRPTIPAKDYAGVMFTSAQAVEGARRLGIPLPPLAWCVGRKTASVAKAAGFQTISADGNADALVEAVLKSPPDGRMLYLRGVDTSGNILERIEDSGICVDDAIVYSQEPVPLTQDARLLLSTPGDLIVPLFSPRTASLFRSALPARTLARLHIAAMSAGVAAALDSLAPDSLVIAAHPDTPAMLAAVETLLVNLPAP